MFRLIITAALSLLITACSLQVYQKQIQQGNIVTEDMLAQLKPGMTKRQVAFIMGTPVLQDAFEHNQWDYMYRIERNIEDAKHYEIRVFFDTAGKYSHYEGSIELTPVLQSES